MILIFGNNEKTTLAAPINNSVTTLTVFPGSGTNFPHPSAGQYFVLTLVDAATGLVNEIMWVTNVTGDTFTIQRGKENTTAVSWLANDFVRCFPTAGTQATFIQPDQAQSGTYEFAVAGGTVNALTATITSMLTALPDGMPITIKASGANTTSATLVVTLGSTILGASPIVKGNNQGLVAGDIPAAGYPISLIWNATLSSWVLSNPVVPIDIGIVGASSDLFANNLTSGTTLNFTASEMIITTSSQKQSIKLINYNQTINLGVVGAGGMDVGSPPTSGFVAIYAIYNPTLGLTSILATSVTGIMPNYYSASNLPSGYIYSCLISIWRVVSSQLVGAIQVDKEIHFGNILVVTTGTLNLGVTTTSIVTIVPLNTKKTFGRIEFVPSSGSGTRGYNFFDSGTNNISPNSGGLYSVTGAGTVTASFADVFINGSGLLVYSLTAVGITGSTCNIFLQGYTI